MPHDVFSLEGKTALVTGGSSGLGRRFCEVLAAKGAHVVAVARRLERLESLVAEIESSGGRATAIGHDVTDRDGVTALFDTAENAAGIVNVLVNCAGIASIDTALDTKEDDWDEVFDVNLNALRRITQECARRLVAAERPGSIVNVASIAGLGAAPGYGAYATSKAAVIHLTRIMAVELWHHDIRVNALCPGFFLTEINEDYFAGEQGQKYLQRIPPKRLGRLDELDGPLLLLTSDASSFMTGVALPVDGGHSARLM